MNMKMKKKRWERCQKLILLLLPTAVSAAGSWLKSALLIGVGFLLMFALVAVLPACRRGESVWAFLAVIPTAAPVQYRLIPSLINSTFPFLSETTFDRVICGGILCLMMWSAVELATGILSRMLWRRQLQDQWMKGEGFE